MTRRALVITAVFFLSAAAASNAAEVGYIEGFALAPDRAEALKQLIPGSQDYYYYHCLHFQNIEQFDRVDQLLKTWINRYKYTPQVIEIQNRQALLTYDRNPQQSLEHIRQRLGIRFNHQRERVGEKPDLPTRLNAALIDRHRLLREALRRYKNLDGVEDTALDWLVKTDLDPNRRRHLLQRLQRPDYDIVPKLVIADLNHRGSRPFGSLAVHRQLMVDQLEACLELKANLLNQTNFVNTYLSKLRPSSDVDWRNDPERYRAYLERLWPFVRRLAPVHNSLKAHVLYHRLVLDRSQGVYDKQRFMTYIRLPRKASYMEPKYLASQQNRRFVADLTADYGGVTGLVQVGNDEPLVRSYLHHFFIKETTTKPYEPFIDDKYLRHQLAETKIVNGLGEPEQWYSWLSPERYQKLKDRIDLDFVFTNSKRFSADESVTLDLQVKNVRNLIVKVFEINTENYYRREGREVSTNIQLDGLTPNEEYTFEYQEPPLRRIRRRFDFPTLDQSGVYVIDFIGNGMSSRAVVRKGRLRHLARTSTVGHVFTILDEQNRPVTKATIWLAGHEYQSQDEGHIVIPYSARPGRQPIVISSDGFSSLDHFQHAAEEYRLAAGIYVDREQLLQRSQAKLVLRPALYLNGIPVRLSVLDDVRLQISSVDTEGVSSTKEVKDFELFEDRESVYEFQVPPRLAQISIRLQARVKSLSLNKNIDLSASEQFSLNQIDTSDKIEDLHFIKVEDQYQVELLGKTGEVKPDRPVQFVIKHRDFKNPVPVTLQTDLRGRVQLGRLADIAAVTATTSQGTSHTWQLGSDRHTYHQSLHGVAGAAFQLPYMGSTGLPVRHELSLLELRGSTFVADRFDALSIDNGMLRVSDLPPGDYDLLLKRDGQRIQLRVGAGTERAGYALGNYRWLELRGQKPLQIAAVDAVDEQLRIELVNATKFARVHVWATRYLPAFSAFDKLSRIADPEPMRVTRPQATSQFISGRNIGDEYQYIINRKYATKYPGNMLERPSALLNPFATRSTQTGHQTPADADALMDRMTDAEAESSRSAARKAKSAQQGHFANLDFLAGQSTVLLNLIPDDDGRITVPLAELGDRQLVHVVAVDPLTTAYRSISLPEKTTQFADLRLLDGLDASRHFTQQRKITVVDGGESFVLDDIGTSRFEVYDSLARIYSLYTTISGDSKLAEFGFLLGWLELSEDGKRAKYSKYACHELNFFLYQKDRPFFSDVVQPYLENKKDKTFLDKWLLGRDMRAYLEPWPYQQLNTVERILLSRRNSQDREFTRRDVRDRFDLLPTNVDHFNQIFLTAIKGSALEVGDRFGIVEAMDEVALGTRLRRLQAGGRYGGGGGMAGKAAAPESSPGPPEPAAANRRSRLNARGREAKEMESLRMRQGASQDFFSEVLGQQQLERAQRLYQTLDKTREWAENNYYQLPIDQQTAELVKVNAFWRDYAEQDPNEPFYSIHFADAAGSFSEMIFALSLLDLPFKADDHQTDYEQARLRLKAGGPLVVFHEEIREATSQAEATPILVSQNFFRHGDRYRHVGNERIDKFVTDEFLVHTVYGSQVVVTNPTSSLKKLDVLTQIPVGALPVLNGQQTRSSHLDLQPYHTETIEYFFYFPQAGTYPHYPVHVAQNEQLLAHGEPFRFAVVEQLSRIDRASWDYLSQNGSGRDVLDYLQQNNLHRTNLQKIAFRMSDMPFFLKVVELLEQRHAYDHTLWSYGIKHNHPPTVRQFLQHADEFVAHCGVSIDSPLLTLNPVARRTYQHLDYRPLVNARTHQLGRRRQIVNDRLFQQYHDLLTILSYHRDLDDDDLLAVTYYLLLQDRIGEAIDFFGQIDANRLATKLQYDYFATYLSLYREDIAAARETAGRYADHPVDRWRNAFVAVDKQLDEIEGGGVEVLDPENRDQTQTQLAASEPGFDFHVEAKRVAIRHQNLERIRVNYYLMDIELLFSRNPFVQQYSGKFSYIQPNMTQLLTLPEDAADFEFPLPEELHNGNVLIELVAAGQSKSQAYYSNSLDLQVIENYGQVRVATVQPGGPLSKVYVKVYARLKDGSVRFFKDGYTDLRGRFDYASLNTNDLDQVERFSLLIMSDDHGSVVREAAAPKR